MHEREKLDPAIGAGKPTNKAEASAHAEHGVSDAAELVSKGRGPRGTRTSKARTGHRVGSACHRRSSAYGKLQAEVRRRSSPRSCTTSQLPGTQRLPSPYPASLAAHAAAPQSEGQLLMGADHKAGQ